MSLLLKVVAELIDPVMASFELGPCDLLRREAEARVMISRLQKHVQNTGVGRYEVALVYAGLGEKEEAFAWLEKSFVARDKGLTYLEIDPCLDPLPSNSRFQGLVRRVGFPT
jgi:hypothetical protein